MTMTALDSATAALRPLIAEEQGGLGSKVVVLKALGGDPKAPYFAMLTQGFPRLVTVARDTVVTDTSSDEALPEGVQARVLLNEDEALLPDLEHIEVLVGQALRQAA